MPSLRMPMQQRERANYKDEYLHRRGIESLMVRFDNQGQQPSPFYTGQQGPSGNIIILMDHESYEDIPHIQLPYIIDNRCDTDVEMTDLSKQSIAPFATNPYMAQPSTSWQSLPAVSHLTGTDVVMMDVWTDNKPATKPSATSRPSQCKRKRDCVTASRGQSPEKKRQIAVPESPQPGPSVSPPGPPHLPIKLGTLRDDLVQRLGGQYLNAPVEKSSAQQQAGGSQKEAVAQVLGDADVCRKRTQKTKHCKG